MHEDVELAKLWWENSAINLIVGFSNLSAGAASSGSNLGLFVPKSAQEPNTESKYYLHVFPVDVTARLPNFFG